MKTGKPEVVLFDGDERSAMRYADAFRDAELKLFRVAYLPAQQLLREPGFDALYWPLPAAERWNVRPVEDIIQVIVTDEADRSEGWPDRLLVGLALSPQNARSAEAGFRTWARALLAAMQLTPATRPMRIKVPSDMIRLSEVTPQRAAAILSDAEREYAANSPSESC